MNALPFILPPLLAAGLLTLSSQADPASAGSQTPQNLSKAQEPPFPALCGAAKPIGPCQPYAEKCLNCTDCTQCGHCAGKGGKCSVCWEK
jgi:hypothetical protein